MNNIEAISQHLNKLRQLTQLDIQCQWYLSSEMSLTNPTEEILENIAPLNENHYITWEKGHQVQWLTQQVTIPFYLADYPLDGFSLRLSLAWWAEDAQIYVNGKLAQAGDLFDSSTRIILTESAQPGESFNIVLRLVSPGHDIGGLMRSRLIYEREFPDIDPGFVADELSVLAQYWQAFEAEKLENLLIALNDINWEKVGDGNLFDQSLAILRQNLKPLAKNIKEREFYLLGHAHLDMAWLWPLAETWEVGVRTFRSVLNLQQEFSDLTFGHTSPILYEWIEQHQPELFKKIQKAVTDQQWELLGGMWVEPDVNLISGESLVRQLLYGQGYFKQKFNQISKVAWLPDSFGFCSQLPQIFSQAGIEYFVTGKLHWNDTNKFPYGAFWWQSPDRSQLMTVCSPPNVAGVMDTNPITMSNYSVQWEQQTGLKASFWLPGVGDHGGGPTRDMLTVKKRWQASEFFPKITSSTAFNYLEKIKQQLLQKPALIPVWQDDLYLEFHRGCYTTHADQKTANRRSENQLYEAELWSSLATLSSGLDYPQALLTSTWKKVLLNQFHDILPGTSIPEVFVTANQDWQLVQSTTEQIIDKALKAIAAQIHYPNPPQINAKPLVIFNGLNWQRSDLVSVKVDSPNWQVYDLDGQAVITQLTAENELLFLAENIPAIGYQLYWLYPQQGKLSSSIVANQPILENTYVRVTLDPETGDIQSLWNKVQQREILGGNGNQLQFFADQGQYWDAWNIDPNYAEHSLSPAILTSIEILETGPIRWRIRVIKQFQSSQFCQDYLLEIHSPILKIQTQVNWLESQVLVKAAFPLNLTSETITYEVPCAVIERPTSPQTAAEKAKWEVSALHWGDLSDRHQNYGVSLLNDCKYGYDGQPSQLRLTLLRSPNWPDPNCDRGEHHFTYALYPHLGDWKTAQTVRQGYQLNRPLRVYFPTVIKKISKGNLSSRQSLLTLAADNLCLMAFKRQENDPQAWILRLYEYQGQSATFSLQSPFPLAITTAVNLLEEETDLTLSISSWKIASFSLKYQND